MWGAEKAPQPLPPDVPEDGPKADALKGGTPRKAPLAIVAPRIGAEALKGRPFKLNRRPAFPPDFRAAYQRRTLIVGEFIKEEPDSRRGIEYPQGMRPAKQVDSALHALRGAYPWIEFIAYLRYRTPWGRGDQRGVGSG